MQLQFFNVINDELRSSEQTHKGTDPRTEDALWRCPIASDRDFEDAVAAAQKALPAWSKTTVAERQDLLVKLADVYRDHAEELIEILVKETGKSHLVAAVDIQNSIAQTMFYAENALEDEVPYEDDTTRVVATHVPLGIVAAICPWNFPLILSNIKVVSALVTGNCVIVKPSPFTPYAVLKWTELSRGILPPGVFQALNGGADLGQRMTLHPGVAKVTFTGTIAVGRRVLAAASKTLKKVTLELAGNNACVVLPDADLDRTVPNVASGGFFNAGQVCVASKRVYVHESVADEFLRRLVAEVEKVQSEGGMFGIQEDARKPGLFGPVANKTQYDVVRGIVEDCRKNGYEIVTGKDAKGVPPKGFWIPPTIVKNPPKESWLVREEQFGPILPVISWSDEDDMIRQVNLSNAGLGASVYSRDLAEAERIARRIEAGGVWINQFERPNHCAYFGGMKDSGYGGEMGKQGLLSYCYTQCLHFAKL